MKRRTFITCVASTCLAAPAVAFDTWPLQPMPSKLVHQVSNSPHRIECDTGLQSVTYYRYANEREQPIAAWRAAVPSRSELPEGTIYDTVDQIILNPSWAPTPDMIASGYKPGTIAGGDPRNPMGICKFMMGSGPFGYRRLHAYWPGTRSVHSAGCFSISNQSMVQLLGHLGGGSNQPPRRAIREGILVLFHAS